MNTNLDPSFPKCDECISFAICRSIILEYIEYNLKSPYEKFVVSEEEYNLMLFQCIIYTIIGRCPEMKQFVLDFVQVSPDLNDRKNDEKFNEYFGLMVMAAFNVDSYREYKEKK